MLPVRAVGAGIGAVGGAFAGAAGGAEVGGRAVQENTLKITTGYPNASVHSGGEHVPHLGHRIVSWGPGAVGAGIGGVVGFVAGFFGGAAVGATLDQVSFSTATGFTHRAFEEKVAFPRPET